MIPKVSVIVPIYNCEKYLSKCLETIIRQTLNEIEIILINDKTPDKSMDIAYEYQKIDSRIRIIEKENSGVSATRNTGIKHARGEYIFFIDSDDYIDIFMLDKMYKKAKSYGLDIITCNYRKVNDEGDILYNSSSHFPVDTILSNNDVLKELKNFSINNCTLFTWRTLFKKTLILSNNIHFPENVTIGEDSLFNMEAFYNCNKMMAIDDIFYNYRLNPTSVTSKQNNNIIEAINNQFLERINFADKYQVLKTFELEYKINILKNNIPFCIGVHRRSFNCDMDLFFRLLLSKDIGRFLVEKFDKRILLTKKLNIKRKLIYILLYFNQIKILKIIYK